MNSGLFEERVDTQVFTPAMCARLIGACSINWSIISPAIFGSLFQVVEDKIGRCSLGDYDTIATGLGAVVPLGLVVERSSWQALADNALATPMPPVMGVAIGELLRIRAAAVIDPVLRAFIPETALVVMLSHELSEILPVKISGLVVLAALIWTSRRPVGDD